jgi:hypothetical protein
MEYKFKEKWDENTGIGWWDECRKEINKIIDCYNTWQMEGNFSREDARLVLAKIEYSKQTIGSRDGGSGYLVELIEMECFVKSKISEPEY